MKQTFNRIQFPLLSDNKDINNIFPFFSNGITELPEYFNLFDDFNLSKVN